MLTDPAPPPPMALPLSPLAVLTGARAEPPPTPAAAPPSPLMVASPVITRALEPSLPAELTSPPAPTPPAPPAAVLVVVVLAPTPPPPPPVADTVLKVL